MIEQYQQYCYATAFTLAIFNTNIGKRIRRKDTLLTKLI